MMKQRVGVLIGILVLGLLIGACAPTAAPTQNVFRPNVTPTVTEWTLDATKDEVIDAALNLAQQANLVVRVLDRQSGLMDFQPATLDAALLDLYCHYPLVNADGTPNDTFSGWHSRSVNAGGTPVVGVLSLSVLVTPLGDRARMRIRTNWEAHNNVEGSACQGTGEFDSVAIAGIRALLDDGSTKVDIGFKRGK